MKILASALILLTFQPRVAGQSAPEVETVYSFTGDGKDAASLHARLVQGKDGNFYGATNVPGGAGNFGTVFKITSAGQLTTCTALPASASQAAARTAPILARGWAPARYSG